MDEDELLDHQMMAGELCDGFSPHDAAALSTLSEDALAGQQQARQALFDYVDAMWDKAKEEGRAPADDPRFAAVAGLRDLAAELLANAENATAASAS